MKKLLIPLLVIALALTVLPLCTMSSSAEGNESNSEIPNDTLIDYGYLQIFKEQLRQELLDELLAEGGITVATTYEDVSFTEGQLIILSANAEIIYRGGGAVAITSSNARSEGITDMSGDRELFSGEPLEYGHIYYASESASRKAILITGAKAYFTVRGDYELG